MTDLIVSNILGLIIGLITSFFSWWVIFHKIIPVIEFADFISKVPRQSGKGHSFRIKFRNSGKRAIIGVEVVARLIIKWEGSKTWSVVYVPLSRDGERKVELPKVVNGFSRTLTLFPNLVPAFVANQRYPEEIRAKAKEKKLTMEDVLSLGKESKLKIYLSGYDEFSGARKMFESSFMAAKDIKAGWFDELQLSTQAPIQDEGENGNQVV